MMDEGCRGVIDGDNGNVEQLIGDGDGDGDVGDGDSTNRKT